MEKLIEPDGYTLEIIEYVKQIKHRMDCTGILFTEQDIKVFEVDENIYILGNPQLGHEPIFDDFGNFIELIPLYNITMLHNKDWKKAGWVKNVTVEMPRLRIMRPDLCAKITNNQVVFGGI